MPVIAYTDVPAAGQDVIQMAKARFADLMDSDPKGPFLAERSNFDDNRAAQLLEISMGSIMTGIALPGLSFTVQNYPFTSPFPAQVAVTALTLEMIRHFVRNYIEIPDTSRLGAHDIQRRDYMSRWQSVISDYQEQMKSMCKKMESDLYAGLYESGQLLDNLIDYRSTAGAYIPWNPAERPGLVGPWW